jgi:hypothetical protein
MSADPERLFSGAKITVSDRRNRLEIYTLEALECLKSWLKISTFSDDDKENKGLDDVVKKESRQLGAIEVSD